MVRIRQRTLGNAVLRLATVAEQALVAAALKSSGLSVQVMAFFSPMIPASAARSQK